jgi:hypothetical protein
MRVPLRPLAARPWLALSVVILALVACGQTVEQAKQVTTALRTEAFTPPPRNVKDVVAPAGRTDGQARPRAATRACRPGYAGARALLVSHWAVESTSARLLTTGVFRRQHENPQLTRAEALRLSMLALIDGTTDPGGTGPPLGSLAHPAFWAPFVLVGDGG